MTTRPEFTLASGPAAMTLAARAEMAMPPLYPTDPHFLEAYRDLESDLRSLLGTEGDVVILPAEAIVGLEAAVLGVGAPGRRGLALSSGGYGTWLGQLLARTGTEVVELGVGPNEALDPAAVETALADQHFDIVLLVHGEGACVNPLEEIARVVDAAGAVLVVDAVSTVGGMPVRVDDWGIGIVVASPHKCLSGPMPLALMAVSDRAWELIESNPNAPRDSSLSLLDYRELWLGKGRFPHSPPVSEVMATKAAIGALLAEGPESAHARHARAARAVWEGAVAMGLTPWASRREIASPSVTAVRVPENLIASEIAAHIRSKYGVFLVDSGPTLRIGHMGETSRGMYPIVGLAALGRGLADFGMEIDIGRGIDAALAVLSEEGV